MIPAYNRTQYLEKTLTSVLSQDPGADEMQIEVVDDASSLDDPEPIVRRIAGNRVSLARNPKNLGLMPNFNNCIDRSRGHWVHILHTDDLVLPGFYKQLKIALEERNDIGAAFCRHAHIDENDRWNATSALERPTAGVLPNFIEKIGVSNRIQFPAIVVSRSAYERLGTFRLDLPYAADWEMWIRIAAHFPVWYEPNVLAAFRGHSESATAALMRSGEALVDLRRCIEISHRWLPPERAETISRAAKEHVYLWMLSEPSESEAVLGLVKELISVPGKLPRNRISAANALVLAARMYYRQGQRLKALVCMARAVAIRPVVAGRPLKRTVKSFYRKLLGGIGPA